MPEKVERESREVETIPVIDEYTGADVGAITVFEDLKTKKKYAVLRRFIP